MNRIIIVLLILTSSLVADVKSTTGQIKFDAQSDNQAEMTLNSTGLGIGVTPSTNLHVNGNAIVTEQVFVGGSSGSSNLNVNGTLGYQIMSLSSNSNLGENTAVIADISSSNLLLSLPYSSNISGRVLKIKANEGDYVATLLTQRNQSIIDLIDNAKRSITLQSLDSIELIATDSGYYLLSENYSNTPFTPTSLSNLIMWIDGADQSQMSIESNGNVSQIKDKSGQGNDANQSDGDKQPDYLDNGGLDFFKEELNIAYLDTLNDSAFAGGNFSFFVTFNSGNTDNIGDVFGSESFVSSDTGFVLRVQGDFVRILWHNGAGFNQAGDALDSNGTDILASVFYDGSNISMRTTILNTLDSAAAPASLLKNSGTQLGATESVASRDLENAIYEFLLFNRNLDDAEAKKIEGYLAWKWGLEDDIASDHPYKNQAP